MSGGCWGLSQPQRRGNHVHTNGSLPGSDPPYMNGCNGTKNGYNIRIVTPEMCFYCFDVLIAQLNNCDSPKNPPFSDDSYPFFVTWESGRDRRLRGCLGTFTPVRLHSGLKEYAILSATRDSRFSAIRRDEMTKLHCSVSLLHRFEPANDYMDWEVGKHGIKIEFYNEKHQKRTATYLPEVATEQGWTKLEAIDSLLRKGGIRGSITADIRKSIKLTRYLSDKLSLSFDEYRATCGSYMNHKQIPAPPPPPRTSMGGWRSWFSSVSGYPGQSSRSTGILSNNHTNHEDMGLSNGSPNHRELNGSPNHRGLNGCSLVPPGDVWRHRHDTS